MLVFVIRNEEMEALTSAYTDRNSSSFTECRRLSVTCRLLSEYVI
jgi:hypothetical protein